MVIIKFQMKKVCFLFLILFSTQFVFSSGIYHDALKYYNSNNFKKAEEAFLEILSTKSFSIDALALTNFYLGHIYSWKSDFRKSIEYYKEAQDFFYNRKDNKNIDMSAL